jgi:hypothetical protein
MLLVAAGCLLARVALKDCGRAFQDDVKLKSNQKRYSVQAQRGMIEV